MHLKSRALTAVVGVASMLVLAACGSTTSPGTSGSGSGTTGNVEVFTWWSAGGEKAGLDALVTQFTADCPGQTFVNAAVAGGAGANAKQVLASRLQTNDPPDTFQAHAGAELGDYIKANQIQDISQLYTDWGLTTAFPQGLISNITVNGKIYSVPANIHRANVLWSNKSVVQKAGITTAPTTLAEFFTVLDKLKAQGMTAPLALGRDWTQEMLFEAVLISDLGTDKFIGLWNGKTDWKGADVTAAINDYKKLLTYTNKDRDNLDWTDAEKYVMDGKAAYQLMGDWEAADLDAKGFTNYAWQAFPGNGDNYQWLADSFVLPVGAKNPDGTKCWLKTVGSAAGQQAFNVKKGSIPARTDVSPDAFPAYQQSAMADWKVDKAVPSCPHGSACSQGFQGAVNSAQGKFSSDGDVASLQSALAAAATQYATAQ
jgi:glucose/mannose transport system substrate-binding protein